jgi:hypothetical protein
MNFLSGYKTLIAGIGLMVKAVVGALLHFAEPTNAAALDLATAYNEFMIGLGLVGLKFAVTKAAAPKE